MSMDNAQARPARVIVVGNEKGGSGKSTVAMHVAIALVKARQKIATIDLDSRQRSLTHYVENRRAWGERIARDLEGPQHLCLDAPTGGESETCAAFVDTVDALAENHSFIVIDTPGHDGSLSRLAHSMADTLITPLNDSFVDFDVLGTVDPETFAVSDISHYAKMVQEVRRQREQHDGGSIDWVVMRNRLSMLGTRNKRLVGVALQELSRRLEFRTIEGFAERMIFREFYPRGLTALDDFNEVTLGTLPTMSHATARQEVANLLNSINLGSLLQPVEVQTPGEATAESDRDAA
jgi:chromosome partitioning protein